MPARSVTRSRFTKLGPFARLARHPLGDDALRTSRLSTADSKLGEVVELFVRREDAEQALGDVLRHEPTWFAHLHLVRIDFRG